MKTGSRDRCRQLDLPGGGSASGTKLNISTALSPPSSLSKSTNDVRIIRQCRELEQCTARHHSHAIILDISTKCHGSRRSLESCDSFQLYDPSSRSCYAWSGHRNDQRWTYCKAQISRGECPQTANDISRMGKSPLSHTTRASYSGSFTTTQPEGAIVDNSTFTPRRGTTKCSIKRVFPVGNTPSL